MKNTTHLLPLTCFPSHASSKQSSRRCNFTFFDICNSTCSSSCLVYFAFLKLSLKRTPLWQVRILMKYKLNFLEGKLHGSRIIHGIQENSSCQLTQLDCPKKPPNPSAKVIFILVFELHNYGSMCSKKVSKFLYI